MSQVVSNEAEELRRQTESADGGDVAVDRDVDAPPRRKGAASDWMQLTKPRIALMVAITAYIGYELGHYRLVKFNAAASVETIDYWIGLAATLVGTAVACMGAGILNQVYERDTDALMNRTKDRPLPAGRLSPTVGNLLGIVLGVVGVGLLYFGTNWIAAAVCAFTIISYWLIYTPLKRRSHLSTLVGAVPGALPPVIGYTAATGGVFGSTSIIGAGSFLLFGIMFLWQVPHFLAIAWMYRDDYARANIPVLPVVEPDGGSTFRQMFLGCAALLPVGLMPWMYGLAGPVYFAGALICGSLFLAAASATVQTGSTKWARLTFFASLIYLPVILILMLVDRV